MTAIAVMTMVMSACVASVEGGPSEPSVSVGVVTTVAVTTTAVTTTSEAVGDDCPDASRGYQCPPDLALREPDLDPPLHSPGTYRTRIFQPVFEFTQESVFAGFESDLGVRLDEQGCDAPSESCWQTTIVGSTLSVEVDLADLAAHECASDGIVTEDTVLGFSAVVLDFHVPTGEPVCIVVLASAEGGQSLAVRGDDRTAIFYRGDQTRFYKLMLSDETEILINVLAPTADFDDYLTEVAEPIIDSIRFLDQ